MADKALALEQRAGLPDALRVLLESYPREMWEGDPGFSPLIRFWLDRHLMFRDIARRLAQNSRAALDGQIDASAHATSVSRFGGMFVNELHGHHQIEDAHYFPRLAIYDARLERGFALLDADHHAIDGHMQSFVESANTVLRAEAPERHDATGRFLGVVDEIDALLDRHLTDEEDLVVPVLLKYGEAGLG